MRLVIGFLLGLIFASMLLTAQGQRDYPLVRFRPFEDVTVHPEPSLTAPPLRMIEAGQVVLLYTPYVAGDGHWWAATSESRTEWVPVAVNGYCPRRRLGDVEVFGGG